MGFIPERIIGLPTGTSHSLKRTHPEEDSSTVRQSRRRLNNAPHSQQSVVTEPTAVTTDTPKYPIGFPSPSYWLRSYFEDWAARWRNVYGTRPASIELRQVLEQFIADMPRTARLLNNAKDKVNRARFLVEGMRDNIIPGCYRFLRRALDDMNREFQENNAISQRTRELVDFLQESIEKHNIEIDQYETRLEEAFISLDRAQSEHAACMALNPHICTAQDVEHVLNQQCDLEQSTAGHDA